MRAILFAVLVLMGSVVCGSEPLRGWVRYGEGPSIHIGGRYAGTLSRDRYARDSISNPYGRYGSKYSLDSVNNKYGRYGRSWRSWKRSGVER